MILGRPIFSKPAIHLPLNGPVHFGAQCFRKIKTVHGDYVATTCI